MSRAPAISFTALSATTLGPHAAQARSKFGQACSIVSECLWALESSLTELFAASDDVSPRPTLDLVACQHLWVPSLNLVDQEADKVLFLFYHVHNDTAAAKTRLQPVVPRHLGEWIVRVAAHDDDANVGSLAVSIVDQGVVLVL